MIWGYKREAGPALSNAIVIDLSLCYNFRDLGEWCNGSTAAFGAVNPGSSPGSPAQSVRL